MKQHPVTDQLAKHGTRLGLDRMQSFLHGMDEPHRRYPTIHIGGTNGKGSVCAYVTNALKAAGYRVGTTLSPHLEHINERVWIDGFPIDDGTLTESIEAVDRFRWEWARAVEFLETPLTYFEFITAVAFYTFAQREVDVAVIEVGLGGRLDATNVIAPEVCAITHVGMDHEETLGNTLEKIAFEKAGICKKGIPVVLGPMPGKAMRVCEDRARSLKGEVWKPGSHLRREEGERGWALSTPEGTLLDVVLSMNGAHQSGNALVALGVLHQLRRRGFLMPDEAILKGFEATVLPGRLETLQPGLWVDGAHNVDGAHALAEWLSERPRPPRRILLWGMGRGRNARAIIDPLLPHVDEVVTTHCGHPKAQKSMKLAESIKDIDRPLYDGGPIEESLPQVYGDSDETIVAGSLFLGGAVRSLVEDGVLEEDGDDSSE